MFEWDPAKNARNMEKHRIRFEEARHIFDGPVLTGTDLRDYGEQREISLGRLENEVVLCVVHTKRQGVTRIICARKANRKERRLFDEYIKKAAG